MKNFEKTTNFNKKRKIFEKSRKIGKNDKF